MSNSKARCGGCKKYFPQSEMKLFGVARFCSIDCAVKKASTKSNIEKGKKIARKIQRERKANFKSLSQLKADAQRSVNRYIRIRDYGKPCISCGTKMDWSPSAMQVNAGHYRSVGSCSSTRFYTLNINCQCVYCNKYLSSNGIKYRVSLIGMYDIDLVEKIESMPKSRCFSRDYLIRIKHVFDRKSKLYLRKFRDDN